MCVLHLDFWEEGQTHRAPGRGPRATSLSLVTLTGWVLKETLAQPDFCLNSDWLGYQDAVGHNIQDEG